MDRMRILLVVCSMAVIGSRSVQAQTITPDRIVKWFDQFGTQTDSVISENSLGNVGIGGPPSADIGFRLTLSDFQNGRTLTAKIENTGPFSGAAVELKTPAAGSDWSLIAGETGGGAARGFFIGQAGAPGSRLSINANNGNVGIGVEPETVAAKLHVNGDFIAMGTKSALIETASYGKRRLYAMESPENWFEDFGSAKLANGKTLVKLDSIFSETVNTNRQYHVFVTPKGDCAGLYVANQTATSFEVRELGKGTNSVAFDYRVVAKRKGYEESRLAEVKEGKEAQEFAQGGQRRDDKARLQVSRSL